MGSILTGFLVSIGVILALVATFILVGVIKKSIKKKIDPKYIIKYLNTCIKNENYEEAEKIRLILHKLKEGIYPEELSGYKLKSKLRLKPTYKKNKYGEEVEEYGLHTDKKLVLVKKKN